MKYSATILMILLFCCTVQAQDKSCGIKVYMSPNFSHLTNTKTILKDNPFDFQLAGSAGVLLYRQICGRMQAGFGVKFIQKGYKYENSDVRYGSQHDGMGNFDPNIPSGEDFTGIKMKYQRNYIGIPLEMLCNFKPGGNSFYMTGGFTPAYFINATNTAIKYNSGDKVGSTKEKDTTNDYRKVNVEAMVGFGKHFSLCKSMELFVESRFEMFAFGQTSHKEDKSRLYSLGLAVGVNLIKPKD